MHKSFKLAGAWRSGLFSEAIILIAKTELRLVGSLALGLLISIALLLLLPLVRINWQVTAYVQSCAPAVNLEIDKWIVSQRMSGLQVQAERLPVRLDNSSPEAFSESEAFRITYVNLSPRDYARIWLFADSDHPSPKVLSQLCSPRSFDFGEARTQSPGQLLVLGMVGWYSAILILVLPKAYRRRRELAADSDLNRSRVLFALRYLSIGAITAICVVALNETLELVGIHVQDQQSGMLISMVKQTPWIIFFVVIVGPFCEELIFRRWLFQSFISSNFTRLGAIVVSASFAGVHTLGMRADLLMATYFCVVFMLSVVLCWTYWRSKSLVASSLAHMAHNALTVALALLS